MSQISVVHSFDEIVSTVSGKSQDRALGTSTETWTLENESEGGFGALLPGTGADWPKVGTLLGVKLEGGAAWGVGIVRRISAFDEKQRYVGIEVLARGAMVVKLMPVGATSGAAAQDAVLLLSDSHEIIEASEMKLLLRIGGFSTQKSFEMRAYERGYLLVPRELVEAGEDFDMASFRLMQRGT